MQNVAHYVFRQGPPALTRRHDEQRSFFYSFNESFYDVLTSHIKLPLNTHGFDRNMSGFEALYYVKLCIILGEYNSCLPNSPVQYSLTGI